jgi:hypothetical protein
MIKYFLIFFLFSTPLLSHDFAYFVSGDNCTTLKTVKQAQYPLHNSLIIPPGTYIHQGIHYDMSREGVYRIGDIGKSHIQRVVYNKNFLTLMKSLAWVHWHGYEDDQKSFSDKMKIAETRKIQMICGSASYFYQAILNSYNIQSRIVLFLTLDPWNSYDNGHTLIEVKQNNDWYLWDVDLKRYFLNDKYQLDALQFCDAQNSQYTIYRYSSALVFGNCTSNSYDYSFYFEGNLISEDSLKRWYKHCAQVLMIEENGLWYFTCEERHASRVNSYGMPTKYMPRDEFKARFYPHKKIPRDH